MQDCEFAYTGDFLCWKLHDERVVRITNISDLVSLSSMQKGNKIGSEGIMVE